MLYPLVRRDGRRTGSMCTVEQREKCAPHDQRCSYTRPRAPWQRGDCHRCAHLLTMGREETVTVVHTSLPHPWEETARCAHLSTPSTG